MHMIRTFQDKLFFYSLAKEMLYFLFLSIFALGRPCQGRIVGMAPYWQIYYHFKTTSSWLLLVVSKSCNFFAGLPCGCHTFQLLLLSRSASVSLPIYLSVYLSVSQCVCLSFGSSFSLLVSINLWQFCQPSRCIGGWTACSVLLFKISKTTYEGF